MPHRSPQTRPSPGRNPGQRLALRRPATTLKEAAGRLRLSNCLSRGGDESSGVHLSGRGIGSFHFPGQRGTKALEACACAVPDAGTNQRSAAQRCSRTALVFIASHTGQQVKRAAVGAEGWVLDPFSRQAVATHLNAVGEPLVKAFGMSPPYAVFSDSLEAYGADWTPDLPAEFKRRRGYDLLPHLPELWPAGPEAKESAMTGERR